MKQYLTPDQTAKLIGLGFERPKSYTNEASFCGCGYTYSIGELIEMLPSHIKHGDRGFISYLSIAPYAQGWKVAYTHIYIMLDRDLVDALYEMILRLKEEGVI